MKGFDRERSAHKNTLLEILWYDDYQIPCTGYGTVEQCEPPPRNESFTQRVQKESPNLKDPSTDRPGRHTEQPLVRTIKLSTERTVDVVDSTRIGIERHD